MNYQVFLNWCDNIVKGASQLGEWLSTPLKIGSVQLSPLLLVSIGGFIVFIGIAILKWVLS